jgi:hypothetical protein
MTAKLDTEQAEAGSEARGAHLEAQRGGALPRLVVGAVVLGQEEKTACS